MTELSIVATVAAGIFLINLPFGYWRAGLKKMSPPWFVAIHAPVPLVIALRYAMGLPFSWVNLPFFVAAYFAGQAVGSRIARRRGLRSG
ncbi:MAG TPA: hypothetical protein VLT59_12450 [Steroidobacteraceae bacterium]|nr:hypothetical protein [Steroidobacteraceae bacterium]